jgi:type I restriction enzyme S subunit
MIPEEWEVSSIEGFVTSGDGVKPGPFGSSLKKEFYSKNGYRVYGQEQVIAGTLKIGDYYIPKELYERLSMFSVQENDILISLVGTTGKVLIVKPPFSPGIINPRLIRLRPNLRNNDVQFMSYLMTSQIVKSQFENIAQTGTMAVLSGKSFRQLTLPKPQKEEQKRISDILLLADSKITNSEIYLGKLRGIKSGLMQDLLSGRVSVKMLMEGEKQ